METEHDRVRRNAQYLLRDHRHGKVNADYREQCGVCILNGYGAGKIHNYINYAGWARVWIQAGKYIEPKYFYQLLAELGSSNRAYADALKQDIREYGLNLPKTKDAENFKAAVQSVLDIYDY